MKKRRILLIILALIFVASFSVSACGGGKTATTGTPAAPQNFTAAAGDGHVVLTWTEPSDNGGSEITKYEVQRNNTGGGSWVNAGLTTTYTFSGLNNGTEYTFEVRAVNDNGSGASATKKATPAASGTSGGVFEYNWNYALEHLPSEFSIIYDIKTLEGGVEKIIPYKFIRTSEGYYFEGKTGMTGSLVYIKTADGYNRYAYNSEMGLFVWDKLWPTPNDTMDSVFKITCEEYMIPWRIQSGLTKTGSQTILGRNCDKYEYSSSSFGALTTFTYWIDISTGICLKMSSASSALGATSSLEYECSEFKNAGVTLPPHN